MTSLRGHTYLGTTQSLCPDCLDLVSAKIIKRDNRIYFRKRCSTHGIREDFVCSDASWYDRNEYGTPGKLPTIFGTEPNRGCPYDCGLCSEHEQHTCIALLEITSNCNLTCPLCFAGSAPGGDHVSVDACRRAIDRLVRVEGQPEVLQLSGGEPTIHPDFFEILRYACDQPIDIVMINTNGIRFAKDPAFLEEVASLGGRVEVYLQFDGFEASHHRELRGGSLLEVKRRAIDALCEAGLKTTLVCTLQSGVNEDQPGKMIRFAAERPNITGVSFQPATYTGRYFLPNELEDRITFPDVIEAIERYAGELFKASDFFPLPCAHPNGHTLAYAYRSGNSIVPLTRLIDISQNLDLLANGIVFTRERARTMIEAFLARAGCDAAVCSTAFGHIAGSANHRGADDSLAGLAEEFFAKAADQTLNQSDLLRITITSFMDAYNFDVRQLMKSCVHHLLPTGHLIPFSAYNVLYRNGHVALPPLLDSQMNNHLVGSRTLPVVRVDER